MINYINYTVYIYKWKHAKKYFILIAVNFESLLKVTVSHFFVGIPEIKEEYHKKTNEIINETITHTCEGWKYTWREMFAQAALFVSGWAE